jgi:uncharacterized damage-inducible protein DinB
MAFNNRWANHLLLTACISLSQDEFDAPRTGFFPSIRATLNHIFTVDHYYIDAMEGGRLGPAAWASEEPFATARSLKDAQAEMDLRLIAIVQKLDAKNTMRAIRIYRKDDVLLEDMGRVLLHLFQHQIHHRGQAHAMLSGTAVPPPQLDGFYLSSDADERSADMEKLGWTERNIWGVM